MTTNNNRMPGARLAMLGLLFALFATVVADCQELVKDVHHAHADGKRDVFAFCGVEPTDPQFIRKTQNLVDAGVTATMGPCRQAPATYSVVTPGSRYALPSTYMALVRQNAAQGLDTVVFDQRLWSASPFVRSIARWQWLPYLDHIKAFDLGDEYPAEYHALLRTRWDRVRGMGLVPYTNMLPWDVAVGASLPGNRWVSFDNYDPGATVGIVRYSHLTNLMCAVNAGNWQELQFLAPVTPRSLKIDVQNDLAAGCASLLIFTAGSPEGWHGASITTNRALALALKEGLK